MKVVCIIDIPINYWLIILQLCYRYSLPQEEDSENETELPVFNKRRQSTRSAASLLSCLRKQKSDQDPLMKRIAMPLSIAHAQVSQVENTHLKHYKVAYRYCLFYVSQC